MEFCLEIIEKYSKNYTSSDDIKNCLWNLINMMYDAPFENEIWNRTAIKAYEIFLKFILITDRNYVQDIVFIVQIMTINYI